MENQTDSTSLIPAPHRWEKIVSIRPVGRAQATCIKVSDPSHLYLTTGGIITHNTAGATTPRSYIGRDGRIRILDTVPESERNAAILEAKLPAGQQLDEPDFERIYAPASPAVRREAERIAKDIMGLRSQPVATPAEVSRFQELTVDLQAKADLTQEDIDEWKQANPEAYAELESMRESVLKRTGWDESVFHGSDAFRAIFNGGAFFTDSRSDASAYAELRALINAVENNDALSEIVYDVMAEEGAEEITDLGPNTVRDIADANSIEIQDAEGFVFSGFLKTTNPLDLREFGTDVGNISELWDNLHGEGLLNEAWSDLDEDTQQDVESDYNGLALYRFLEQEGIQSKAFQMGYDAVIFEDISPDGRGTHSSWLTQSANQFKSADPLNLEDGKLITPDQWADSESDSILRSQSAENFNRWFADSKIVTPDGSPWQVFHGSNGPIEAFQTRNIKRRDQTTEWSVLGAFFTPQRKEAEGYANWATQERGGTPTTQGYYLSIKNPKRLTSEQIDKIDTEEQALDLRQRLEAAGHDGIIIMARGGFDGTKRYESEYVAFEPTQIKSATDNTGEYGMDEGNVLRAQGDSSNEQRIQALQQYFGKLDPSIKIKTRHSDEHKESRIEFIRGRTVIGTMDGEDWLFTPGYAIPIIPDGPGSPRKVFSLAGDKSNWVHLINKAINKLLPKIDEQVDEYIEPFGGGLVYLQNLDFLQKTEKPVTIAVSRAFEPERHDFYTALKSTNQQDVQDIAKLKEWIALGAPKKQNISEYTEAAGERFARLARKIVDEELLGSTSARKKNSKAALRNMDALQTILRKPKVKIVGWADWKTYQYASEQAAKGVRVALIDDSNYANLAGESTKTVYGDQDTNLELGIDSVDLAFDEVPDDKAGKSRKDLLERKNATYGPILAANGVIISTNHIAPVYFTGLLEQFADDGAYYAYPHRGQGVPDMAYTAAYGTNINWQPARAEYLGILKKGLTNESNIKAANVGADGVRSYAGGFDRFDSVRRNQTEQADRAWDSDIQPSERVSGTAKQQRRTEQPRNVQGEDGVGVFRLSQLETEHDQRVGAGANPVEQPTAPPAPQGDPAPKPVADTAPAKIPSGPPIPLGYTHTPGANVELSQAEKDFKIPYDPSRNLHSQNPFDYIEKLEALAFAEVDGSRTIGDPRLAHSMDSDTWRAYDQFRKEQFQKQREDDWKEAAHIMVREDYQGTIEGIIAKSAAGESLTPIQTKAAEIIIAAETAKGIYDPQNKDIRRRLVNLIHAVRTTRTETARTLAAFRDPHRTPAERWKQFVGEALFAPGKKTKRLIEEAPSQAAVDARIRELEERMQRVASFSAGQQTENASLRREIERLRETATKEQLIDSEIERNKSRIEKRLAEMGITVDDLLTGPVELRLMGAKMIGEHMKTRTPLETQVLALLQGKRAGAESKLSDVATRMRISVEEVKRINDEFREEMRAELKSRFKKPGFQLQNLELAGTDIDQNAMRSNPGERSDEEAERMAEEALRMMGFYSSEEYDKVKVERPRSKTKSGKKKDRANTQVNALDGADIPVWTMEGDGLPLDTMIREAEKQRHSHIRDKAATMPTGEGRTRQGGRLDLGEAPWDGARAYVFDPNNSEHVLQMTRVLEAATRDVTGWDYVNELFISNLLSAPTTQIVNITGYAYGIGRYTVGRAVRAMLNQGKDEGAEQWGEFKPMFEALVDHLPLAFANAAKAWRTELPVTENLRLKTADTFTYLDEPMGVIPGTKGKIIRIPLRVLLAVDEFSKTIFGYTHAATLAYRMGKAKGLKENNLRRFIAAQLRDRSSGIWPEAQREARYVAFQQQLRSWQELKEEGSMHPSFIFEGGLKFLSDIKNADFSDANVMMKLSQFALRLTFPFVRTPYRLLEIGLEMTPIGALAKNVATRTGKRIPNTERRAWMDAKKAAERLGKEARQKGTKEARDAYQAAVKELQSAKEAMDKSAGKGWMRTKQDERKVLEAKSAAITAAMLVMLMWRAAEGDDDDDDKMVLITGTIPNSEATPGMRQLRDRTHPPQSIGFKIPGSKKRLWIDYRRLDPLSTLIATQVDAINEWKKKGIATVPTRLMSSIYAQLLDKASLQGFSDLSATLSGDRNTDFASAAIDRLSTIFIPNLVRNIARNTDPIQRARAYNIDDLKAQAAYAALPISSFAPPPAIDLYGRPVKKKGGFMSRAVIPGNPFVQGPPTPTDRTLMAWNQQNPGDPYAPSAPNVRSLLSRYERLNATPQQIQRFTILRGQIYSRLAAENGFNNLRRPTPQQMDEMQKLGSAASNEARKAVFGE